MKSENDKTLIVEPIGLTQGAEPMYAAFLSNALADAGADVTMVTFDGLLAKLDSKVKHVSYCASAGWFGNLARFLGKVLRILSIDSYWNTHLALRLASKIARKDNIQTIHILDIHPLFFPNFIVACSLKKNTIISNINSPSIKYDRTEWQGKLKAAISKAQLLNVRSLLMIAIWNSRFIAMIEKKMYLRATKYNIIAFVCHSNKVKDSYNYKFFSDKMFCIPWGMKPVEINISQKEARQRLGLPEDGKILLSFGVNHCTKNYEVIFKAIRNLPKDFTFVHAGKIDPAVAMNEPKRLATEYGWTDHTIIFDDFVAEEMIQYYFVAADGILLSYTKEFLQASGVLSHASSYNLPVIASDIGQLGELVKAYQLGLTFIPEDHVSLKQAIINFLKLSEDDYKQMKANLKAFAASNSWEEVATKHIGLYRSLSNEKRES